MAVDASMPKSVAHGIDDLRGLIDKAVGPSEWCEVTQEMVNQFADLTGDHQWIHTTSSAPSAKARSGRRSPTAT